ncbi:MAG: hypothetical protein IKF82_07305 [Bacilli bacterium]|nr:hypothetical protein [Bacilli bacterium]
MSEGKIDKTKLSLIIWSVFFVIILLFVRGINSNFTYTKSSDDNNISMNSYEFVYSDDRGNIYGKASNGKYLFILDGNKYYFNGNNLYLVSGNSLKEVFSDLGLVKITPSLVDGLIKNVSQNDSDGNYYISLYDFMSVYDVDVPVDGSEASKYNIVISKYSDEKLSMIKVDLSNYYLFKGISNTGIITINFYNQDNVSDFSKGYDKLEVVK